MLEYLLGGDSTKADFDVLKVLEIKLLLKLGLTPEEYLKIPKIEKAIYIVSDNLQRWTETLIANEDAKRSHNINQETLTS